MVLLAQDALALILATSSEEAVRNGSRAIELAAATVKVSNQQEPLYLDTLAAAYAESGDFAKAVEQQQKAIDLTTDDAEKADFRTRLELYQARQPYREEKK